MAGLLTRPHSSTVFPEISRRNPVGFHLDSSDTVGCLHQKKDSQHRVMLQNWLTRCLIIAHLSVASLHSHLSPVTLPERKEGNQMRCKGKKKMGVRCHESVFFQLLGKYFILRAAFNPKYLTSNSLFFLTFAAFFIMTTLSSQPCVATIGSFDGVHLGHLHVISQVVCQARMRGLGSRIVTFPNHPLQVLRPDFHPQVLSPVDEKLALLKGTGIDHVSLIEFTPELARMTAKEFMKSVLKEKYHVAVLLIGYDNHFGCDRRRGLADYQRDGRQLGIEVLPCDELAGGFSSTAIRQALCSGDIANANRLLGHRYTLWGKVVEGFQNGRSLGYPTANLQLHPQKLIPQNGAYLVSTPYGHGMLNIGSRPTFHNGSERSIEVHIFDFDDNLYGSSLRVELMHRLRGEREFSSTEELKAQLQQDEQTCRQLISK